MPNRADDKEGTFSSSIGKLVVISKQRGDAQANAVVGQIIIIIIFYFSVIVKAVTDGCIVLIKEIFKTWCLSTVLPKFEVSIQEALVAVCHFEQLPRAHGSSCFAEQCYGTISEGDNEIPAYRIVSVNQNLDCEEPDFPPG